MHVDYKHTLILPRDSVVIRFYMWLWHANPRQVNFCKLFWGYIFAIPALIVRAVAWPFVKAGRAAAKRLPHEEDRSPESYARAARREQLAQRSLQRIENGGVRVVMVFSAVWRYLRYPVVVVCGLAVFGVLVFLVYQLSTAWADVTVKVLLFAGGFLLFVGLVAVPLAFGIMALAERGRLDWVGRSAPRVLIAAVAPFVFFFWVMKMGFLSVKSNTCPRVELSEPGAKTGG